MRRVQRGFGTDSGVWAPSPPHSRAARRRLGRASGPDSRVGIADPPPTLEPAQTRRIVGGESVGRETANEPRMKAAVCLAAIHLASLLGKAVVVVDSRLSSYGYTD